MQAKGRSDRNVKAKISHSTQPMLFMKLADPNFIDQPVCSAHKLRANGSNESTADFNTTNLPREVWTEEEVNSQYFIYFQF